MPHITTRQITQVVAFFATLVWAAGATAQTAMSGAELASSKGCYNCHGAYPRGDAPPFERLSQRVARVQGDAAAEQKSVDQLLAGEPLQHIGAHELLTRESALALIRWLGNGAK